MAFKEISSLDADTVISLGGFNKKLRKDNPKRVEGYYIGSRKVDSPKAKSGFSYIHIFQTDKGSLGVWGKTDMDKKILQVKPGTMTQVTHSGMKPTKNGEMYTYTVAVDTDNTIEVSVQNEAEQSNSFAQNDDEETVDEYAAYRHTASDSTEDQDDEELTNAANERAAKVKALLNKNKNKSA